jgi:hypothetical protein
MEFVTEVCYNYKFIQDVFLPHIHTTIDKISTRNKVVIYKRQDTATFYKTMVKYNIFAPQ